MMITFLLLAVAMPIIVWAAQVKPRQIRGREENFPHVVPVFGARVSGEQQYCAPIADILYRAGVIYAPAFGCDQYRIFRLFRDLDIKIERAQGGQLPRASDFGDPCTVDLDCLRIVLPEVADIPIDQTSLSHDLAHWLRLKIRGSADFSHNLEPRLWVAETILRRERAWLTPAKAQEIMDHLKGKPSK